MALMYLTNNIHLVGGIDVPGGVGHVACVSGAVLRLQVLQREGPLRALALARACQEGLILPPGDGGRRGATRQALETHGAAQRLFQHPPPHLSGLAEAWFHCQGQWSCQAWCNDARETSI